MGRLLGAGGVARFQEGFGAKVLLYEGSQKFRHLRGTGMRIVLLGTIRVMSGHFPPHGLFLVVDAQLRTATVDST